MKKHFFILFLFSSILVLSQTKQPNILVIMTDQHAASALSCMGNDNVSTPNIDRLANQGTIFNKAYVTYPLCTPSRASMFSGKMPHELEIYSNAKVGVTKNDFKDGLGVLMTRNGYESVYAGKWHIPELSMPDGIGFTNIANMGDEGLAESCVAFLDKTHEKPFFMVASFVNPHDICEYARGQRLPNGSIEETDPKDCPNLPINHPIGPYDSEILRLEQKFNPEVYPTTSFSDDDWRQYLAAYYKLVEKVDTEIGKVLDALEKNGLDKNTIVIFTSDHGDGISAHHWNQKTVLFDESVRVPLIVKDPSLDNQVKTTNQLVSIGLDFMPSILDIGGANKVSNIKGQSIKPALNGGSLKQKRDFLVIQTMFDGPNALQTLGRALVTDKYKYVIYGQGKNREQLFDLEKDPYEMTNLAYNSKYNALIESMRKDLYAWCVENNDKVVMKRLLIYPKQ
ncbi:sulfatase family protein [Aestuariivivens insulae]|uniref:sulfatase family protein n=1 Tax=Aestuariivivens insulae TaxID=1621988 RepID=UPI001F565EB1|nr:sulfatase-like hydrolase/transferase [Aestuariivivens insulae]